MRKIIEREDEEEKENRSFPVALFSLQDSSIGTLSGECTCVSKDKKREREKCFFMDFGQIN